MFVFLKKKKARQKLYSKKKQPIQPRKWKLIFLSTHPHTLTNLAIVSCQWCSLCETLLCPNFSSPHLYQGFLRFPLVTPFLQRNVCMISGIKAQEIGIKIKYSLVVIHKFLWRTYNFTSYQNPNKKMCTNVWVCLFGFL